MLLQRVLNSLNLSILFTEAGAGEKNPEPVKRRLSASRIQIVDPLFSYLLLTFFRLVPCPGLRMVKPATTAPQQFNRDHSW